MSSFRRIEYFLSVAKHLNFTKAARECCGPGGHQSADQTV